MQALSRDILAGNAYRTLGVGGTATQAEIDSAARRMRIWPDERRIPPTDWDAPWLGPIARSRPDIERALAALNEPGSRVEHRLLWYQAGTIVAMEEAAPAAQATITMAARHDRALRALHVAYTSDPEIGDLEQWRGAVRGVRGLASSPDYAAWLSKIEEEGNFEKRASAEELNSAVDALPEAMLAALVPRAQAALDRDDLEACAQIALLLKEGGGGTTGPMRLLLDRLDDALAQQCREMETDLHAKLRTRYSDPQSCYEQNRVACHQWANFYNQAVAVSLDRFLKIALDDADRSMRARVRCAQVLALLAMGWEWSGQFLKAAQTQRVALDLAKESAGETQIRKDLERYEAQAQEEQRMAEAANALGTSWVGIEQKPASPQKAFSTVSSPLSGIAQQSNSFSFSKKPASKSGKRSLIPMALILAGFLIKGLVSVSDTGRHNSDDDMRQLVPYQIGHPARADQSYVNPPVTTPAIDPARVNDPFGETSRER